MARQRGLTASRQLEDLSGQGHGWWTGWSDICLWINQEEKLESKTDHATQGSIPAQGNEASKPLTVKTCEGCGGGRNSQPHRRVHWRDPQGPRIYTNTPTWESTPEGPNLLVCSVGSD